MITVKELSIKYDSHEAVSSVSFEIDAGDYLCIVGENGSGKTTLMKALIGLLKPSRGQIAYEGIKQNEIGYIPQQAVIQKDFPTSVFEVVLSGRLNKKELLPFYSRKDKQRALENLALFHARDVAYKPYSDLSGGQQQRVLLARALCATEKILLLDEPTAGLDPVVAADLYQLLRELNKKGITIVMISHDVAGAAKYCSKILHLDTAPLFYGTTAQYLQSEIGKRMLGGTADA